MLSIRILGGVLAAVALGAMLTGCGEAMDAGAPASSPASASPASPAATPEPSASITPAARGETATWELAAPADVTSEATTLDLAVTRLSCAGGKTGDLLPASVVYDEKRIVIRVDAVPLPAGAYTCQSNQPTPLTVALDEPIGGRELVDAACLEGDAVRTAMCETGAVRWP